MHTIGTHKHAKKIPATPVPLGARSTAGNRPMRFKHRNIRDFGVQKVVFPSTRETIISRFVREEVLKEDRNATPKTELAKPCTCKCMHMFGSSPPVHANALILNRAHAPH